MNREDLQHIRDRLMMLAEASAGGPRQPFVNVKRKAAVTRQSSKTGPKLSVQDFVRMDPGYTPDIEHLVFPVKKQRSPQQQAPSNPAPSKTRSRLAEMFALSRHLQQRSTDRSKSRNSAVNRSIDSALGPTTVSSTSSTGAPRVSSKVDSGSVRRWVCSSVEEPVRQNSIVGNTRLSPAADSDMASAARGPNVSVLHLRSTSEPWETSPTSSYAITSNSTSSRPHFSNRSTTSSHAPPLTKHQSLGNPNQYSWTNSPNFHSGAEVNSPEIFTFKSNSFNRELSPVRWCDREVDGVYLGRSGWVQVQQRSLDENRRFSYTGAISSSLQSKRTGIKLANYHFLSEPSNKTKNKVSPPREAGSVSISRASSIASEQQQQQQRPAYLSLLQPSEFEQKNQQISRTPSPLPLPESFSPPSLTPIISPPPAFQDKDKNKNKPSPVRSRTFFGKTPFLPRANAIEDSDNSPPPSPPPLRWKTTAPSLPQVRKPKAIVTSAAVEKPPRASKKMPQTKSLEDTTTRRTQFVQNYRGSSSSSSSSMGFRSLDSSLNRTSNVMPRLLEHADSSVDVCEDADEEDNNSSSINISIVSSNVNLNPTNIREKASPSSRSNRVAHYRGQTRRSPAGSDTASKPLNCTSRSSSSTSSNEFLSRSPPAPAQQQIRRSAPTTRYQPVKSPQQQQQQQQQTQQEDSLQRVRRSRSLQLPEKKAPNYGGGPVSRDTNPNAQSTRISPDSHRVIVKVGSSERPKRQTSQMPPKPLSLETTRGLTIDTGDTLDEDMLREAEVVTGFLYGNRSRAAAQALLMHRYNNNNISKEEKGRETNKPAINNGLTVYYVGNSKKDRQKVLLRGSTSPNLPSSKSSFETSPSTSVSRGSEIKNRCNQDTCDFWPHCAHRDSLSQEAQFVMRSSQTYPSHQRSLDSATMEINRPISTVLERKTHHRRLADPNRPIKQSSKESTRRLSPNKREDGASSIIVIEKKTSPVMNPVIIDKKSFPVTVTKSALLRVSGSSSGSDVRLSSADKRAFLKTSGGSTPVDGASRDDKSRPGSAPETEESAGVDLLVAQSQRSMSLPKSFLSASSYQQQGGPSWQRYGTESVRSSPGFPRKTSSLETAHTAPVTPLHDGRRGRSPLGVGRRVKATSTPQLLEQNSETRKWGEREDHINDFCLTEGLEPSVVRRNLPAQTAESVLQKFRKTFSLRFQKRGSKETCNSDVGETLSEILGEPSEEDSSPQHVPSTASSNCHIDSAKEEQPEHKYKFGPLIWRTSKERKKVNKAARNAKCNSGDSGIQIEMASGCTGNGDSSESHDTDPPADESDSPPVVRRRQPPPHGKMSRPQSDLLNQILIDKFKADLKQRAHKHQAVRRTRSDLGGQRLLNWDPRSSYRRMMSSPAPFRGRPQSPRKKPPDAPGGVVLRPFQNNGSRRGNLRRSLSQPLDIDKLSPLMRAKASGFRHGSNIFSDDDHDARNVNTSDDEMMSDSESSVASLSERKKSLELAMDEEVIILAEAVFDHVAIEAEELAFRAGDVIEVLETANRDWWWGSTHGKSGWFPAQFVRLRVSQEDTVEDCLAAIASGKQVTSQLRRRTSISLLSNDQVRTSVVRELVNTERDFVKVLRDVAEGYISECRKRKDMFTDEQIATIFINIEEILRFQTGFLKDLEECIDWEAPSKSCVGGCFLKHRAGFKMYSDYCNSHPMATASLQELYRHNNYSKFFEACRLMRGLIEIPLDGYLLTPVQRICKYPLQLAELLKYTKVDHEDYVNIKEALEVMRSVAMLINERKRRMESLEKLAALQQRVEGWEGEDLIEVSSQLIHQGEVVRVTTGMWTNNITLLLFDHQILYCKKDLLKRNTYVYKGRICLDTCDVTDVPDGKDLGVTVRHAIKLYCCVRDKWLLFCCRSAKEKDEWLEAFEKERKLVVQDKDEGLEFPPAARQLAKLAARCQKRPPRKPRNGKSYKHDSGYMGSTLQLNSTSNTSNLLGRKVGTWFTFGANKKTRHNQHDVS